MTKVIKELIIMFLVCLLTMLAFAVTLYIYIPSKKFVPEIQKYAASDEVKDLLDDDIDTRKQEQDENKEYISTFYVTSQELRDYQSANDYIPGKANPFAEYAGKPTTENPSGEITEGGSGEDNSNQNTDKPQNQNANVLGNEASVYTNKAGTK